MKKNLKFIKKAQQVHGNIYDYSKVQYVSVDSKVEIICKIHGSFFQTPRNHLYKKNGCNLCAVDRSKKTNTKTTEEFIREAEDVHGKKYDYSKVQYVNATTPVEIICRQHGSFFQQPTVHTSKSAGCKKCAVRGNTSWFVDRATKIHNNKYQYTNTSYTVGKDKVCICCKKHGEFFQRAESHLVGIGCPKCGHEQHNFTSMPETEINDMLKGWGYKTETNNRDIIYPKEIDIYLPDKKVAIEYNGNFWHSELKGKDRYYHLQKTQACAEKGITLIHIFESEWVYQKELVKSRIFDKLGNADRVIPGRKCSICSLSSKETKEFLDKNHMQGNCPSFVRYGLVHGDDIVAVMTFGKPRYSKEIQWELLRFCSQLNTRVIGGASKLLHKFIREHSPKSMVSYSDKRWNVGNLYTRLGFEYSHSSRPNYFYFSKKNPLQLMSRHHFQKHKLSQVLDVFDPNKTEWENMQLNGYDRMWDCGNDVFVWKTEKFR